MRAWIIKHFRLLLKIHNLIIVLSIISITVMLTFLNSDIPTFGQISPKQWVGFLFFPVGVIAGMLLGWWREILGGAVTVVSLLGFERSANARHRRTRGGGNIFSRLAARRFHRNIIGWKERLQMRHQQIWRGETYGD